VIGSSKRRGQPLPEVTSRGVGEKKCPLSPAIRRDGEGHWERHEVILRTRTRRIRVRHYGDSESGGTGLGATWRAKAYFDRSVRPAMS
jgi:hypothetical protein